MLLPLPFQHLACRVCWRLFDVDINTYVLSLLFYRYYADPQADRWCIWFFSVRLAVIRAVALNLHHVDLGPSSTTSVSELKKLYGFKILGDWKSTCKYEGEFIDLAPHILSSLDGDTATLEEQPASAVQDRFGAGLTTRSRAKAGVRSKKNGKRLAFTGRWHRFGAVDRRLQEAPYEVVVLRKNGQFKYSAYMAPDNTTPVSIGEGVWNVTNVDSTLELSGDFTSLYDIHPSGSVDTPPQRRACKYEVGIVDRSRSPLDSNDTLTASWSLAPPV